MSRETQHIEAITGMQEACRYAASHHKYSGLMYGSFIKSINKLGLSGRYLEMGAGPGFLAMMLADRRQDIEITAVDLSPDMVAVAGELIREKKLKP